MKPPDAAELHAVALAHLGRFAATEAGLLRVLDRCIDRWVRQMAALRAEDGGGDAEADAAAARAARQAARAEIPLLVAAGLLDDAAFAAQRAQSLVRSGRSARAITAHLAARGIGTDAARAAIPQILPDGAGAELSAALAFARRRRIGPFATVAEEGGADAEKTENATRSAARMRAFGMLARAGFSADIARAALGMDRDAAEARLAELRRL